MLVPSWIIVILAFVNVGLLGVWAYRFKTLVPIALMLPMLYIGVGYALFDQMDLVTARIYSRWGVASLLFVLTFLLSAHFRYFWARDQLRKLRGGK